MEYLRHGREIVNRVVRDRLYSPLVEAGHPFGLSFYMNGLAEEAFQVSRENIKESINAFAFFGTAILASLANPDKYGEKVHKAIFALIEKSSHLIPVAEEIENKTDIEVDWASVRCGSVKLSLHQFMGPNYTIKHDGKAIDDVRPHAPILEMHVGAPKNSEFNNYGPMKKSRIITRDLIRTLRLIQGASPARQPRAGLTSRDETNLYYFSHLPITGMSHLVNMLSHANIPIWEIDLLWPPIKNFMTVLAQQSSYESGGTARLKTTDIKMFYLTPQMRSQLLEKITSVYKVPDDEGDLVSQTS